MFQTFLQSGFVIQYFGENMGRKKKFWTKERVGNISSLFKFSLSDEIKISLLAIFLVLLAILIVLSLADMSGNFGVGFKNLLLWLFGFVAYILPVGILLVLVSLLKTSSKKDGVKGANKKTILGGLLGMFGFLGLWQLVFALSTDRVLWDFTSATAGAGVIGTILSSLLIKFFGPVASAVILTALLVAGLVIISNWALSGLFAKLSIPKEKAVEKSATSMQLKINSPDVANFTSQELEKAVESKKPEATKDSNPSVAPVQSKQQDLIPDAVVMSEKTDWKLPSFDLLNDKKTAIDSGNIEANAAIIRKTLSDFGISVEMGEVNVGPTVTQYTLRPAVGVKLSQIAGLKNDLALALAASSLRMELPIPGKPFVGVEVPNRASSIVRLRDVMQTPEFINHKSPLVFALGRDVAGGAMLADITKMPHLLIAGSTGTGKSVALNSLILSLLYRNTPQQVKLILIDPKRVEMRPYNGIPHLITAPILEPDKAVNAMKWAVGEMDRRFKLFSDVGKRSIVDYNESAPVPLPYIVIIMDELADLMTVAQADIEAAIVRLAQMSRAVGIHLVLATQSPRVDIITGLIKANISSRIAFKVTSQSESRIILDMSGADQLLGNGDMLFVTTSDGGKPKRVQGSFVDDDEVKRVADYFKNQAGVVMYNDEVVEKPKGNISIPGFSDPDGDDLLDEAKQEVLRAGKASASFLQRRLKVGYARAARLLDLLEQQGVVGPGDGAKPREVYGVSADQFQESEEDNFGG